MDFRLAVMRDLPGIQTVYEAIVQKMNREGIRIWDEVYPCSFFEADIQNQRLYILLNSGDIVAAFALCDTNAGETSIAWQDNRGKALYLDRLGVNTDYVRSGLGSLMLEKAKETAKIWAPNLCGFSLWTSTNLRFGCIRKTASQRAAGLTTK